jgi:hydroxypyruvate reductase
VTDRREGDTEEAAARIVAAVRAEEARAGSPVPRALLFGGETTLRVTGNGSGGRNQHLALKAACLLRGCPGITLLAAGTDGTDGPTDAAGAVVDGGTCGRAEALGLDPCAALRAFDSHTFFREAGGLVVTGPTLTNVMDVVIALQHDGSLCCW